MGETSRKPSDRAERETQTPSGQAATARVTPVRQALTIGATAAGVGALIVAWFSVAEPTKQGVASALGVGSQERRAESVSSGASLIESAQAKVDEVPLSARPLLPNGLSRAALAPDAFNGVKSLLGDAEVRLIEIYQQIGAGNHRQALTLAEQLVDQHPNFQLAQLVLGDLLSLQTRPIRQLGDVPDTKALAAQAQLAALRDESRRRISALTERPPEGRLPSQILALGSENRHVIAVDASRSRLYLFENLGARSRVVSEAVAPQLRLVSDFYISVGLSGIEKMVEGDQRTPLGVYFITSNLDPAKLPDLYGAGALPINYPNALDLRRGKTGHGIWLHGTPSAQFVRAPLASDGCVVLSNPDLERLLSTVAIKTTPVIIAPELHWVEPEVLIQKRADFDRALAAWKDAKSSGNAEQLRAMYSDAFRAQGRDIHQWWLRTETELRRKGLGEVQLSDVSLLHWRDTEDTMVVNFNETLAGQPRSVTKRQYWGRENGQWKIFFEGPVG